MRATLKIVALLFAFVTVQAVPTHRLQCPLNASGLAFQMLESNIGRSQGIAATSAPTSQIELGIFQQALRAAIRYTKDSTQKDRWSAYLQSSVQSEVETLSTASIDAGLPLDRLSIGTSMIFQYAETKDESLLPAISALKDSVLLQQRNANGGLWYYDNAANLTAYHNLSYADGMFSYPAFAILAANSSTDSSDSFGPAAALKQVEIIYDICRIGSGLLVHGYDASKNHTWANPKTGASPIVWGRSLAWYTLGIVNALDILQSRGFNGVSGNLKAILKDMIDAQVAASGMSLQKTGTYGVWQVVDRLGETFDGHANFIEASASSMTVYSLLKGSRHIRPDRDVEDHSSASSTALGIYSTILDKFLIHNENRTLSFNGTSSVASLAGNVDFEYYVTRPTVLNSLIGTSAFILASFEVDRLCCEDRGHDQHFDHEIS